MHVSCAYWIKGGVHCCCVWHATACGDSKGEQEGACSKQRVGQVRRCAARTDLMCTGAEGRLHEQLKRRCVGAMSGWKAGVCGLENASGGRYRGGPQPAPARALVEKWKHVRDGIDVFENEGGVVVWWRITAALPCRRQRPLLPAVRAVAAAAEAPAPGRHQPQPASAVAAAAAAA